MPRFPRHIAIIQGHPDPRGGHFCHALMDAYGAGAQAAGHRTTVIDVAQIEFPLARSRDDLERAAPPQAIAAAQQVLAAADHVVLSFPVWNGSAPALLRGFLEQVMRRSFVFPDAASDVPLGLSSYFTERKALAGRSGRVVATMQMPAALYRWFFRPHLERNSLSVSGIGPIRESLIGGIEAGDVQDRRRWLSRMDALGRQAR